MHCINSILLFFYFFLLPRRQIKLYLSIYLSIPPRACLTCLLSVRTLSPSFALPSPTPSLARRAGPPRAPSCLLTIPLPRVARPSSVCVCPSPGCAVSCTLSWGARPRDTSVCVLSPRSPQRCARKQCARASQSSAAADCLVACRRARCFCRYPPLPCECYFSPRVEAHPGVVQVNMCVRGHRCRTEATVAGFSTPLSVHSGCGDVCVCVCTPNPVTLS